MNVLFVSIDSLRRDFLGAYSDRPEVVDYHVETDNLDRFAERATVFDTHYAGSLPCMPARREWLAGTHDFLWRPWGPMEPFDDPIPELARDEGIVSQLVTDHFHYFQHGSNGYYEDFNGFEFVRGNEYDAWRTSPREPPAAFTDQLLDRETDPPDSTQYLNRSAYARNAAEFETEADFFAPKVFSRASEWLRENQAWDQWFCFVDSFDVHEPFHVPEPYASMYTDEDPADPDMPVWPYYGPIDEGQSELTDQQLEFVRSQFAGSVTMIDRWFGRVLDTLDEEGLWDDTMVVVGSDHGFALGDHGWVGKNDFTVYDVIANTPLMIWHPETSVERVSALTSAVDLYETILDGLGIDPPSGTHSRSLMPLVRGQTSEHRDHALYGLWGSSVNVTDGRYTYHRPPELHSETLCHSTSMQNTHSWFTPPTARTEVDSGSYLPYTDASVWRYPADSWLQHRDERLYDRQSGPGQSTNLAGGDEDATQYMVDVLRRALDELDAPDSQYDRLGL
ncbi:sulfatase-like hydrolase/transferase [Halorientalis sp.]|uniref:sulfatase-like hydrolase/transferase n=1 Tax=Halorientalis sp. TaxID=1931229 RepID=UPI002609792F|nr:sulfatase-like hydrolase/transferase [Halorientalis sp.]